MKNVCWMFALVVSLVHAGVATAQSVGIHFSPEKSRYARGETIGVTFVARDAAGRRIPNTLFWVGERIGYQEDFGYTGFFMTNSVGEVRISYRVPTNPYWDNMHLCGATWFYRGYAERRIPIGR